MGTSYKSAPIYALKVELVTVPGYGQARYTEVLVVGKREEQHLLEALNRADISRIMSYFCSYSAR
jgi:hypothetical protein